MPTVWQGGLYFVVAALTWLSQRIIVTTDGHIERHRRKQLVRDYHLDVPPSVHVVQLRRAESHEYAAPGSHEQIDWSCRWVVGGHWRNHAVKDGHKLMYILPYVKGPEDKPLRVPGHTVYSVSR